MSDGTDARIAKLEQTVTSLCSLVHYLITEPDFYNDLKEAEAFDLFKMWGDQHVTASQLRDEMFINNTRVDRERHLKAVGINLYGNGDKFRPSPKL